MKRIDQSGWRYFVGNDSELDNNKCGKWMYFFKGPEGKQHAEELCRQAVESGIVPEAKRADSEDEGVACFYLNCDDLATHKKIIKFFIDHGMIRRTKAGKLYDISFKLDRQTQTGLYGESFSPVIKLSDLMDLYSEEWLPEHEIYSKLVQVYS